MADLPADRLEPAPPFTNIGVDVFGPWSIVTRRTRGGIAQSKRWAVIFVCLVVRAIHIEVIEDMSASSFVNALRRFTAIRGEVKVIRSDRGSNFIGSIAPLHVTAINVEDGPVKDYLGRKGTIWIFNAPHSSHMGGAWERLIGISRKVLDSTLLHEVLVTLMAEVCSIVNARPLVPVSTDPESPFILSPATLLTMKNNHAVQSFSLEEFNIKNLYKQQWKQVQYLANQFWSRWRREYLPTIQVRRKWQDNNKNLKEGDVVLLKDKSLHRNDWPLGIIEKTLMSGDECVRKVEVRLAKDSKVFTRPISEIVLLLSDS